MQPALVEPDDSPGDVCTVRTAASGRSARSFVRIAATPFVTVVLAGAVWFQRATIGSALSELRGLSTVAVASLIALTIFDRWSRADIVRRLLGGPVGTGRALTIHDVGTAASKGVPLGGALGTTLRWSISRDTGVQPTRFASMLIAYGVATTFATWLLPLGALLVDLTQRSPETTDFVLIGVLAAVLVGSVGFWALVLRSDRLESWAIALTRRAWAGLARRVSSMQGCEPESGVAEVRRELRGIARRPWGVLGRTVVAQACGAFILLVALRSLGVGPELGTTEFFRVFFLAHLAGTFAPTPGGVGVVEAGMTGALMAAGVDTTIALAGVLIYRFATYVLPIVFGAILYVGWRVRGARAVSDRMSRHGTPFDASFPYLSRASDQGIRHDGDARRDDRTRTRPRRGSSVGILLRRSRAVS